MWRSKNGLDWTMVTANAGFGKRKRHAAALYDNKMWVMGGTVSDAPRNDVWYSSDGNVWTQATAAAPWPKREHITAVVFNDKLWLMGGEGSTAYNDVWSTADGKNWTCATQKAEWPARSSYQVIVFDGKMWILGGCTFTKEFNDMWYSSDGVKWTQATPLAAPWKPRKSFRSVIFDNKLWVIAGSQEALAWAYYNDVWYYEMPVGIFAKAAEPQAPAIGVTVNAIRSVSGSPVAIRYTLNKTGNVRIGVYTCTGREIRMLWHGTQDTGTHTLEWNGCDVRGERVGAGTFFVQLKTGAGEVSQTIVVGVQ